MITIWSKGPADDFMPEKTLVETLVRVQHHPWWLARAELALAVLRTKRLHPPARILDVGCGWGVNLQALERGGYQAAGMDISRQILERIDEPRRQLFECDLNKPFPAEAHESYDGLLLLDVIEHLDDDQGALRRLSPLVCPGGTVVVSVPALPELFSEFDSVQGHRRRYVPETVGRAFQDTGFALDRTFWWGQWMVPVLKRMRISQSRQPAAKSKEYSDYLRLPPWPLPLVMSLLFRWEKNRALNGKLTTGTSLFAIATREKRFSA